MVNSVWWMTSGELCNLRVQVFGCNASTPPTSCAPDNKGCSNASLKGTFAFTRTGFFVSPPAFAGPLAEVGTQNFDGRGATTYTATLSQNSNIVPVTATGSYTVNPDCTGTMTMQVSPFGITLRISFALANSGNEFHAIETKPVRSSPASGAGNPPTATGDNDRNKVAK